MSDTLTLYRGTANSDLSGGSHWNKKLVDEVASSSTSITLNFPKNDSAWYASYDFTEPDFLKKSQWQAGNITTHIEVTTASSDVEYRARASRVDEVGAVVESTNYSATHTLGSTGYRSVTIPSFAWDYANIEHTDRLRIEHEFRSTAGMMTASVALNITGHQFNSELTTNFNATPLLPVLKTYTAQNVFSETALLKGEVTDYGEFDDPLDTFHGYFEYIKGYAVSVTPTQSNRTEQCDYLVDPAYAPNDRITNVNIYSNARGVIYNRTATGYGANGYKDFTSDVIELIPGENLTISVTAKHADSPWSKYLTWGHAIATGTLAWEANFGGSYTASDITREVTWIVPQAPGNYFAAFWTDFQWRNTDGCKPDPETNSGERWEVTFHIEGDIFYPDEQEEWTQTSPKELLNGEAPDPFEFELTGLEPGVGYVYRALLDWNTDLLVTAVGSSFETIPILWRGKGVGTAQTTAEGFSIATGKGEGTGTASLTAETIGFTGYFLQRQVGSVEIWETVGFIPEIENSWVDEGPFVEQETYHYRIKRYNPEVNQIWSNVVSIQFTGEEEGVVTGFIRASGIGLTVAVTTNIIIAFSKGSGIGQSTQSGKVIVTSDAAGSGLGEGSSFGEVISVAAIIDASAHGTGIGNTNVNAVPLVLSMVYGTGVGGTYPNAYIENISAVSGSGVGTPNVHPELLIVSSFEGFGVGGTAVLSVVEILSSVTANGIGDSTARSIVDVVVSAKGSGVGSSSFEASAIIYGSIAATGQGQAEVFTENIILTMTYGSGVGGTYPNSIVIILPSTFASGIGTSPIENFILFVTGNFIGAGVGTGQISSETITPMVESSAKGYGQGFGHVAGSSVKSVSAHGSGKGSGGVVPIVDILISTYGNGVGTGLSSAYIDILSNVYGTGIGIGFTVTDVIGLIVARSKGHGLGLGQFQSMAELLQKVHGSGIGFGATQISAFSILENSAAGHGAGTGTTKSENVAIVSAKGSGQGAALNKGLISSAAGAAGTGIGSTQVKSLVVSISSVTGEGSGQGAVVGKVLITGIFKAAGIGTSTALSESTVDGQFTGNGIGRGFASEEIVGIITSSSAGSGNGSGKVSPVTIVTTSGKGSGEGTGWSGVQKITAQNIYTEVITYSAVAGRKITGAIVPTTVETEVIASGNVIDMLDGQVIAEIISKSSVIGRKIAKYELNIDGHNRISIDSSKTSKKELTLVITPVTTTSQSSVKIVHIYGTATIDVVIDSGRKVIHTDYDEYCRLYEMPLDFTLHPVRLEFELKEVDLCIR